MKALYRFRFLIFGVAAVALVVATVFTLKSDETSGAKEARGSLGPTSTDVGAYAATKRSYLKRAAADDPQKTSGGLVSLSRLIRPSQASTLVSSGKTVAVFVRFPASDPQALKVETTVRDTMALAAQTTKDAVQAEITGLEREVSAATGARKKTVEDLLAQRKQGVAQIGADCACIYALVVENSTLASLGQLAKLPDVRLVDVPDPPVSTLRGWNLRPLLPTQRSA
jgi:hypothetical protein